MNKNKDNYEVVIKVIIIISSLSYCAECDEIQDVG